MKKNDILEKKLSESIKDSVDSIEVPEMESVWKNIENELEKETTQKFYINKKIVGIIAIIFLSGSFLLISNNKGFANYPRFLTLVSNIVGDKLNLQVDYDDSKSNKIFRSNDTFNFEKYKVSFEQAQKRTNYIIRKPKYLPSGYKLKNVILSELNDEIVYITLSYQNDAYLIKLQQEKIKGQYSHSINVDANSKVKKINKDGYEYNILNTTGDKTTIIWNMFETKFTLSGKDEKNLMKIASSIK